jgi:predicted RNA methylase
MAKKLSDSARGVLSDGIAIDGHKVRITMGLLDRKVYLEVNAALETIGGKWNRKEKAHLFDQDPTDALDQILVDGVFHDRKRDLNQFFTPPALAKLVVEKADVRGKSVLEPSAGHGAIALEARQAGAFSVHCVELDKLCVETLEVRGLPVDQADFMRWAPRHQDMYQRIAMNPPFARQQDIDHVRAAYGCLRAGGRLVAVMSAGTRFRVNRKGEDFRSLLYQVGGTIEELPPQSFRESGTDVNAVLVTMEKKA